MMTSQTVTLQLPERLYRRAHRVAKTSQQSLEETLIRVLDTALPPMEADLAELQREMQVMAKADDETLLRTAGQMMPAEDQRRMHELLDIQSVRPLTPEERDELSELISEYSRLTLLKAKAYALLAQRGHPLPTPR